MATVFPGEKNAANILADAFKNGLRGVKLHSHVQCFGTDFPNLPYAWDREIKNLVRLDLSANSLAKILGQNACQFYSIKIPVSPE